MTTITIPATYVNWVVKPKRAIRKNPSKIFITVEYEDDEMSLADYLKSDEYKNDDGKYYTDIKDFLSDLRKWI